MIEETEIVQDTRKIRSDISERFGNEFNRYIDFLQTKELKNASRKTFTMKQQGAFHYPGCRDPLHGR